MKGFGSLVKSGPCGPCDVKWRGPAHAGPADQLLTPPSFCFESQRSFSLERAITTTYCLCIPSFHLLITRTSQLNMGPKKGGGENSKKAQGQARKAEAAAGKQAQKDREAEAAEAKKWDQGSKSNSKA